MRDASLIMKSTLPNNITWKQINWLHVYRYVEKLQQRIYRAESLGDKRKVRELQRLLMHSKSALLLSTKRVTQINKGKKTAGVDGFTVLTDGERIRLYRKMADYQISCHLPKPSHRTYYIEINMVSFI